MCWEGVISGGRNEGGQLKGDTYQRRLMAKSSSGKNAVSQVKLERKPGEESKRGSTCNMHLSLSTAASPFLSVLHAILPFLHSEKTIYLITTYYYYLIISYGH